jgi:hypothetical protein
MHVPIHFAGVIRVPSRQSNLPTSDGLSTQTALDFHTGLPDSTEFLLEIFPVFFENHFHIVHVSPSLRDVFHPYPRMEKDSQ